jgi:hypothetical protein
MQTRRNIADRVPLAVKLNNLLIAFQAVLAVYLDTSVSFPA